MNKSEGICKCRMVMKSDEELHVPPNYLQKLFVIFDRGHVA